MYPFTIVYSIGSLGIAARVRRQMAGGRDYGALMRRSRVNSSRFSIAYLAKDGVGHRVAASPHAIGKPGPAKTNNRGRPEGRLIRLAEMVYKLWLELLSRNWSNSSKPAEKEKS